MFCRTASVHFSKRKLTENVSVSSQLNFLLNILRRWPYITHWSFSFKIPLRSRTPCVWRGRGLTTPVTSSRKNPSKTSAHESQSRWSSLAKAFPATSSVRLNCAVVWWSKSLHRPTKSNSSFCWKESRAWRSSSKHVVIFRCLLTKYRCFVLFFKEFAQFLFERYS